MSSVREEALCVRKGVAREKGRRASGENQARGLASHANRTELVRLHCWHNYAVNHHRGYTVRRGQYCWRFRCPVDLRIPFSFRVFFPSPDFLFVSSTVAELRFSLPEVFGRLRGFRHPHQSAKNQSLSASLSVAALCCEHSNVSRPSGSFVRLGRCRTLSVSR